MQTLRQLAQLRNRLPELIFAARDLVCGLRARRAQPAPVQGLLQFCEPAPGSVVQAALEPLARLIAGLEDPPP